MIKIPNRFSSYCHVFSQKFSTISCFTMTMVSTGCYHTNLVFRCRVEKAIILPGEKLQLGTALCKIPLLKPAQSSRGQTDRPKQIFKQLIYLQEKFIQSQQFCCFTPDIIKVCLQIDTGTAAVLFEVHHAGLPLLHGLPVTQGYITLTGLISQKVQHLWRTLTGLQQHSFSSLSY